MAKLDLREKLKQHYQTEDDKVKEKARGTVSGFLGIDKEDVSVRHASPHDKGIYVYLEVDEFQFIYNHPNGKIEFSLDGALYPVENRADVGRIISFKENKEKFK